ncbi:MAG: hypothetical protein HDS16_07830 [Bacteroides sp.]|nr:hypothetical protein [Bacteroides sp.]
MPRLSVATANATVNSAIFTQTWHAIHSPMFYPDVARHVPTFADEIFRIF